MSATILISVIIPAYNYGRYLADAVASVAAQAGETCEVIIIDDGSTDDTPAVGARLTADHAGVVSYRRQDNAGPGAARNAGTRLARGRFYLFLDADDRLLPGALDAFAAAVRQRPELGLVASGHVALHEDGRRRPHAAPPLGVDREFNFAGYIRRRFGISNGAALLSAQLFEVGGFPEDIRNGEDVVVFARALAQFDCAAIPEMTVEVRKHAGSLRNNRDWIARGGDRVVGRLFDERQLPTWALRYRDEFAASQEMSLFRSCYLAGDKRAAREHYLRGLRLKPSLVLNWSYLRKCLRVLR